MKGFIFGFHRFVWCPKCTPASNNSGTNSVVSAIREIPEGELPKRDAEHATTPRRAQPEIGARVHAGSRATHPLYVGVRDDFSAYRAKTQHRSESRLRYRKISELKSLSLPLNAA